MRCLEEINGVTLSQINDFTRIPTSIINATSFSYSGSFVSYVTDKPAWLNVQGDLLYNSLRTNMDTAQSRLLNNQYFNFDCPSGEYLDEGGSNVNGIRCYNYINNQYVTQWGVNSNGFRYSDSYRNYYAPVIILDDDNQRGYIFIVVYSYRIAGNTGWQIACIGGVVNGVDYIYESYGRPAYNWISVPSVSGKNGILSLASIKDEYINNGESVTGASLSNFDTPPNISNVLPLINDVMPDDDTDPTSVRVTFGIPALAVGTYSQIKLLTKKDAIPRSVEDADIVTNLDEPTSITRMGHTVVGNLAELTEYYFTIHVEDEIGTFADSEPVGPVRTGKHEGMIKMQIMITGGISENGFAEAVSYEKVTT